MPQKFPSPPFSHCLDYPWIVFPQFSWIRTAATFGRVFTNEFRGKRTVCKCFEWKYMYFSLSLFLSIWSFFTLCLVFFWPFSHKWRKGGKHVAHEWLSVVRYPVYKTCEKQPECVGCLELLLWYATVIPSWVRTTNNPFYLSMRIYTNIYVHIYSFRFVFRSLAHFTSFSGTLFMTMSILLVVRAQPFS